MLSLVSSPNLAGQNTLYGIAGYEPRLQKLVRFFELVLKSFLIRISLSEASTFGLISIQLSLNTRLFLLSNLGLAAKGV